MKCHWFKGQASYGEQITVCGRLIKNLYITNKRELVDCSHCQRIMARWYPE